MKKIFLLLITLTFFQLSGLQSQTFRTKAQVEKPVFTCENLSLAEKPTIGVLNFENKVSPSSRKYWGSRYRYADITNGLSDMMVNALVESGCFRVTEKERLQALNEEVISGMLGETSTSSAAQAGQRLGAKYLVMGAITEFKEVEKGGGLLSLGGGGLMWNAHVGLIIRIVNTTTGEVMISKSVNKKVNRLGLGSLIKIKGKSLAGAGFFQSKAMKDAIEKTIIETVGIICNERESLTEQMKATPSAMPVSAEVNTSDCSLFAQNPTFMVIIPEQHIQRRIPDPAGETEIIRSFIEAGVHVVDPQVVAQIREGERFNLALNNDNEAAALGAEFDADYIVIGEAFSESVGQRNGMHSCRARVEARIVRTTDGRIMSTNGLHASGLDVVQNIAAKSALKAAGNKIANYFLGQLCTQASQQMKNITALASGKTAEVFISNIDFSSFMIIAQQLEKLPEVQQIVKKQMSGNTGRIQISHTTILEEVAMALYKQEREFKLEILSFNNNKLELTIQ